MVQFNIQDEITFNELDLKFTYYKIFKRNKGMLLNDRILLYIEDKFEKLTKIYNVKTFEELTDLFEDNIVSQFISLISDDKTHYYKDAMKVFLKYNDNLNQQKAQKRDFDLFDIYKEFLDEVWAIIKKIRN